MVPLMIEAALNGATPKARNPHVPKTPDEIAVDALACLEAGAAIIHTHIDGYETTGDAAVDRYMEGWTPVMAARPDAILYATIAGGRTVQDRFDHYRGLAGRGMRMGAFDPGSVNLATHGDDGLPGRGQFVYSTSYKDIGYLVPAAGRSPPGSVHRHLRTGLPARHPGLSPRRETAARGVREVLFRRRLQHDRRPAAATSPSACRPPPRRWRPIWK